MGVIFPPIRDPRISLQTILLKSKKMLLSKKVVTISINVYKCKSIANPEEEIKFTESLVLKNITRFVFLSVAATPVT